MFLIIILTILVKNCNAFEEQFLINHVIESIQKAYKHDSKLNDDILNLDGMSSAKVRHLLNNLCSLPGACYLEIGVYRGSTFTSALYQNTHTLLDAIAIDNWSEHQDGINSNKHIFLTTTKKFLNANSFRFFEHDAFTIDIEKISPNPITIYFYDGNHDFQSQKKAFSHYNTIFDDIFIALVDDWNWTGVPQATKQVFKELEYTILFEKELPANGNLDRENWWDGLYIAVIKKNK